jgi:hypothetical protein
MLKPIVILKFCAVSEFFGKICFICCGKLDYPQQKPFKKEEILTFYISDSEKDPDQHTHAVSQMFQGEDVVICLWYLMHALKGFRSGCVYSPRGHHSLPPKI